MPRMSKEEFVRRALGDMERAGKERRMEETKGRPEKTGGKTGGGRMRWTEELVGELRRLLSDGLAHSEIAERLGIDLGAVKARIGKPDFKDLRQQRGSRTPQKKKPVQAAAGADETYIAQLEQLLKERTEEAESLKRELCGARKIEADNPVWDYLSDARALADCVGAVNLSELRDEYSLKVISVAMDKLIDKAWSVLRGREGRKWDGTM